MDLLATPPTQLLLPSPPLDDGPKSLRHLFVHLPLKVHHLHHRFSFAEITDKRTLQKVPACNDIL